jgi:hypothetical protein
MTNGRINSGINNGNRINDVINNGNRINDGINNGDMRGRYRYFRARSGRVTSNGFCNIVEAMSMRIN